MEKTQQIDTSIIGKTYLIHDINENTVVDINALPCFSCSSLLTFDDGLYSQFFYKDRIHNHHRIYFICPSLINKTTVTNININCYDAMNNHFFLNDNSAYMTINNIYTLLSDGFTLGAHSYFHDNIKYKFGKKLNNKFSCSLLTLNNDDYIRKDTELLLKWFDQNLKFAPIDYAFPFNQENEHLITILKEYGFRNFYGKNRLKIS